jgi:hypothetical protein
MSPNLDSVLNVTLDRTPQEWIVGIVIALFLALALAGVNMAFRRWVKAKDETVPLVGLGVVAIFAGMVIAGMYFELNHRATAGPAAAPGGGPGGGPGGPGGGGRGPGGGRFTTRLASLIFDNADADHDGVLSVDEAANAAAKFVHDTDASGKGKGKLDLDTLTAAIRERLGPPGGAPPAAAAPALAPSSPPPSSGGSTEATPPAAPPSS